MKSNLICMLITIVAYLILMIVVGILASKKIRTPAIST